MIATFSGRSGNLDAREFKHYRRKNQGESIQPWKSEKLHFPFSQQLLMLVFA